MNIFEYVSNNHDNEVLFIFLNFISIVSFFPWLLDPKHIQESQFFQKCLMYDLNPELLIDSKSRYH